MNSSTKQARPPGSAQKNSPCTHKENHEEVGASPLDKKQKIGRDIFGTGKTMASPKIRARQAFSEVHNMGQEPAADVATNNGNHTDPIGQEFTKEDVEALLNMKMKGKAKFDYKGKTEQMTDYIKKLRACIRWLQEAEESSSLQKENVQNQLLNERNEHKQTEDSLKDREQELQMIISDLNRTCLSLEDRLQKEEAEKWTTIEDKKREIDAREEAEKKQRQLSEELEKAQKEVSALNQLVSSVQDINKRLQEYNASLQQYNGKLQSDAASAAETISKLQKEKSTLMETLSTLRGHSAACQEQLANARASLQECENQKKVLVEENSHLRGDLQRIIDERDQQTAQVQTLTAECGKYKECTGKTAAELEQLATKTTALEESFSSQSEHIRNLCIKLEVANHKLQIQESSVLQQREVFDEQKQKIEELRRRLEEAELQNFEGELVRRKLHNTILELKGNIRVFCRVRPIMPEDECPGSDSLVVQYPASAELTGRGIDLIQGPGQKHPFIFDKVFGPEAGQEEVFIEISQLVQSALDGYKANYSLHGILS